MKKQFYNHIVTTESLYLALEKGALSEDEKKELQDLIDTNLHYEIVDLVLSELHEADKKTFLKHLAVDDHDSIWNLLNQKISQIEDKIRKTAEAVTKELHKEIAEAEEKSK